jgi:hypothetical protein
MADPNLDYQVSLYMTHAREMIQVAHANMVYEPDEPAAQKILTDAQRFVERVQAQLTTEGFDV